MYDLIIIGGGPAGITAAIYAARQKLNFLMVRLLSAMQITNGHFTIEDYEEVEQLKQSNLKR